MKDLQFASRCLTQMHIHFKSELEKWAKSHWHNTSNNNKLLFEDRFRLYSVWPHWPYQLLSLALLLQLYSRHLRCLSFLLFDLKLLFMECVRTCISICEVTQCCLHAMVMGDWLHTVWCRKQIRFYITIKLLSAYRIGFNHL